MYTFEKEDILLMLESIKNRRLEAFTRYQSELTNISSQEQWYFKRIQEILFEEQNNQKTT